MASFDLGELLKLDHNKPEIDIEAVAQHEDSLWWIGSHGQNKNGKERKNRRMLFSTNIPPRDLLKLEVTSPQYSLISALRSHSSLSEILTDEVLKTPPKRGGLNIEGMAFAPNGSLMLGLRSPLSEPGGTMGDALIIYLSKDEDVWSVSSFVQLDLESRGIRDMVWADGKLFLIAGPVPSGGAFDVYAWSGDDSKPQRVIAPGFKGFNPEALVRVGPKWLMLSDDGGQGRVSANGEQQECKDLAAVKDITNVFFRARLLSVR